MAMHALSLLTMLSVCRMMESKVAEAMSKKETLKARALSAETTKQLNDSIVSMVSELVMDQHSLLCFAQDLNEQKQLQQSKVAMQINRGVKVRCSHRRLVG